MQKDAENLSKDAYPGCISIHNKSAFNKLMSNTIPPSNRSSTNRRKTTTRRSKSAHSHSRPSTNKQLSSTYSEETNTKKLESKKRKILKYHSELEKWRKHDLERTLQSIELKKSKDEAHFRKTLNMIESRGGIYGEIADVLYKHQAQHTAKSMNLHSNWQNKVYYPIKKNIKNIANDPAYMVYKKGKMRTLYNKYLSECNKPGNNIFLDSINKKEYDPFEWEQSKISSMQTGKVKVHDPLKSDLNKYIVEQNISKKTCRYFNKDCSESNSYPQTARSSTEYATATATDTTTTTKTMTGSGEFRLNKKSKNAFSLKPKTRFCISPIQYNCVDHLPLFRDMEILKQNKTKCILPSHVPGGNVLLNQFDIPKYDAAMVKKQFFPETKRIVQPPFSKYAFNISEQW